MHRQFASYIFIYKIKASKIISIDNNFVTTNNLFSGNKALFLLGVAKPQTFQGLWLWVFNRADA